VEERRKVDGTGFVRWLGEWLAVRASTRTFSATTGEVTWPELQEMLQPDELGLFFVLLQMADGRATFEMHPDQLLSFLAMSCERFDRTTTRLVELGLVAVAPCGESVEWTMLRQVRP
jgi:hypothetical protein